jgi:hypothetical protein
MNEITLEEALKPFWEIQDRFYEDNKHLTMRQLVEKIEGRPYDSVEYRHEPPTPILFRR